MTTIRLYPGERVLFLTKDMEKIRAQMQGRLDLRMDDLDEAELLDDVNTDQMTPAWVCFDHRPEDIAVNAYAGLIDERGRRVIGERELLDGPWAVIVSGQRKGTGSSRETAAQCEKFAGIRMVAAASFAPIHARNNHNLGQPMGGYDHVARLQRGEAIPIGEFTAHLDPITRLIVESGGLFAFSRKLAEGSITLPPLGTRARAMTMAEKIIARHLVSDPAAVDATQAPSLKPQAWVKPGDAVLVKVDGGYSHEFTTAQVHSFLAQEYGAGYRLAAPERFAVFEDHLLYADDVAKMRPFMDKIQTLRDLQVEFQRRQGVLDYNAVGGVSPGICHQIARESMILPGDFIQATDSHTCMGGANNALAYGVGATEYAALVHSGFTVVEVPESIRFELHGALAEGVTAKDVMLFILAHHAAQGLTLARVMEFGGPGLFALSLDERATLTNMATECSAKSGLCEADDALFTWLSEQRTGFDAQSARARSVAPDPGAQYAGGVHRIDLSALRPMVAKPSDPTYGALIADLGEVPIDIAYGGSCTAGKREDLAMYARVTAEAVKEGRRVHERASFYIQFGSQGVEDFARAQGFLDLFERAGVRVIKPGCGACIGCGPGVSERADQVTISAINRNFTGRSGPGKLYLGSPLTVAASAFTGRISAYHPGMFAR